MNTLNFQSLIQNITKRNFVINTTDLNLISGKEYQIFRMLPLTAYKVSFMWKVALSEEKVLRSFITAFCTKYKEPNPKSYNYSYGGKAYTWEEKSEVEKESCQYHHGSHMFSKTDLMVQIEENFNSEGIEQALIRYGFYPTEYGIGIFCFWDTVYVRNAINKMATFLNGLSIPYGNEYSDARWVLRFKLNIGKDAHSKLIGNFNS